MKTRDGWIAVVFLIFIFLLPAATLIDRFFAARSEEAFAEVPAPGDSAQETIYLFPPSIQNNVNEFTDQLFMRKQLIAFNTNVTSLLTGGTYFESTQVLLGKDNWLFYKSSIEGEHPIWDYMGINHFSEEELLRITANLQNTQKYFEEERGIPFYIVTIPNKEIVYSEYMPDTIIRLNEVSRGQQLSEYVEQNTALPYLDLRYALLEAKEDYPTYYRTDSHWNYYGAYVGLQEIFQKIYGDGIPADISCFSVASEDYSGDLAALAGLQDRFSIDSYYMLDPDCIDKGQYHDEVLLLVGDSFSEYLRDLAKYYYRDVHYVHSRDFQADMIDQIQPDIVIWECVERYLDVFSTRHLMEQ